MAIYEYECETHGVFENLQSIKSEALDHCPKCKEEGKPDSPPKRLISLSSFSLHGGGWAKEGYS